VGYFSLLVLSQLPRARVYAYEPMPQNFRLLRRHVDANPGVSFKAVMSAVASSNEPLKLQFDSKDEFTTSASIHASESETDVIEVRSTTLADIFREENLDRIDLLKLDCEGSEYEILFNLPDELFNRISNISLEAHQGRVPSENIDSLAVLLQAKGFKTLKKKTALLSAWRE
ncbi:MAG: FkbM family methyltransferase, partial [Stenotrophobium sp.]